MRTAALLALSLLCTVACTRSKTEDDPPRVSRAERGGGPRDEPIVIEPPMPRASASAASLPATPKANDRPHPKK